MLKHLLGIDIGTSSVKVLLVDEHGKVVNSAVAAYPLLQPQPGWTEQDPEDWWKASCTAVRRMLSSSSVLPETICAVGLSGQMHGMTPLDEKGRVLRNAILWNDQRNEKQCEKITETAGGLEALLSYTNNRMLTGYTAGKILWMRDEEPELYKRTRTVLNPKDYIRCRLSGELITEVSDASGTGLFSTKDRSWAWELIDKLDLPRYLFPKCVESTEQTGKITDEAAKEIGLPSGIPIYGGGGDAVLTTVGAGIFEPGRLGISLGTSGVASMSLSQYAGNPAGKLQMFCSTLAGQWVAIGCTLFAAGAFEWYKETFGDMEQQRQRQGEEDAFSLLDRQAGDVAPGADGLLFYPYLNGERVPLFDSQARASFLGIHAGMGKGHFTRAVLEGVAYSLRQAYEIILEAEELPAKEIIISGGGAKSEIWKQIFADVFELPVISFDGSTDASAFGAALVAGIGHGVWKDPQAVFHRLQEAERIVPLPENSSIYRNTYAKYLKYIPVNQDYAERG